MKNKLYPLLGSAVALLSAAGAGFALGKKKQDRSPAAAVFLGGLGILTGAMITQQPRLTELRKKLTVEEIFSKEDAERIQESISELLGNSIDQGN